MTRLLSILFLLLSYSAFAADNVKVSISDVNNYALQQTMESNVSKLLSAINAADTRNSKAIDFKGISITDDAANSIAMIWHNVHFRTVKEAYTERCLTLQSTKKVRGYEIMNIEILMKPQDKNYKGKASQEATITFDAQGKISDFVVSSGIHQYNTIMKDAVGLDDLDKRMQILHFVEQFRTAYCQKDLQFMQNIFSNDALIITGRVMQRKGKEIGMLPSIVYDKYNKVQYMENLRGIFARCKYVNVKFSDITIERNGAKPYIYGVTCTQDWQTKRTNGVHYEDLGKVFMLWDFSDEDHPMIHVRTWQPTEDTRTFSTQSFRL